MRRLGKQRAPLTALAVAAAFTALLPAAYGTAPSWWGDRGVINPQRADDDYQAANAGQLKNIATAASAEMYQQLAQFGGAGPAVTAMAQSLMAGDDYAAINQGQLKHVAKPFYDRLIEIGYCSGYPWGTGVQDDWALMNIGQLKNVFSFDLAPDTDEDGMPDWWEAEHGLNPESGVDPSLKAWWTFDEGSGSQALDATGNGYSGTIANPDRYVPGKFGSALEFDGMSDQVTVPQANAIIGGNTFTVSAWVWLDQQAHGDYHTAVADLTDSLRGYWLGFDMVDFAGQLEIFWGDGAAHHAVGEDNQALYRGAWAHAVGTCDGTTKTFYLNGQYVDSAPTPAFAPGLEDDLLIGNDVWGYRWEGKIDEVRIYSSALGAAEIASMYDALSNPDDDGLTSLEEYQYGTDPWMDDTDQDGLTDGDEVNVHLTNPVNSDSDGDGLADGAEVNTHGTDALDPDSDGDWASDGFEVQEGTDPTLAGETPGLEMRVNDDAYYATSPYLVLDFPGLVADSVVVYEVFMLPQQQNGACVVLSEGKSLDHPENGVLYELKGNPAPVEDGEHFIEVRAARGEEVGPVYAHSVVLDREPPTLVVTSPEDGSTTGSRWIRVAGNATDEIGPVRVYIEGEWADGVAADGFFWYDRFILEEFANTITVVAEDMAGHVVEQQVTVHQDLESDTDAPVLELPYPSEGMTVGDKETVALHGTIDDETAAVEFTVTADGVTSGPHFVNVIDGRIWGSVPLSPGENTVEIVAADARGNQSTQQFTVERTPGITFEITSPSADVLIRDLGAVVYVEASEAELGNAAVMVNGVPAEIDDISDGLVTFKTQSEVPLGSFLTPLEAKATDPTTGDWYDKLTAQGYEIFSYGATNLGSLAGMVTDEPCWHTYWTDPDETRTRWSADERPMNFHETRFKEGMSCNKNCTCDPISENPEEHRLDLLPPSSALFEDVMHLHDMSNPAEDYVEVQRGVTESDARYTFRKYVEGVDKQLIILHFYNVVCRGNQNPFDPTLITFRGEPGFAYGENGVGFLQEIKIGATNSFSKADFDWPSFSDRVIPDWQEWGMRLEFDGWGNKRIRVVLDHDVWWFGGEDAANFAETATLTAQGVTSGTFRWYIVSGASRLDLNNGGADTDDITTIDDNTILVKSKDRSAALLDTKIRFVLNGRYASDCRLTIRAPHIAERTFGPHDAPYGLNGFKTTYRFRVLDQFGVLLPREIEVNEWFGIWASDWTVANGRPTDESWSEPSPNGTFTGSTIPIHFTETYAYATSPVVGPSTVNPGTTHATEEVQHAHQTYQAGSLTPGGGLMIKAHTLQHYRGQGRQVP